MSDAGFADPRAARAVARRLVLRERLRLMVELGTGLLDRLDHQLEADGGSASAAADKARYLALGDGKGAIGGGSIDLIERENVRQKELLQGLDLALQLLDAVGEGIGHGLFSTKFQSGAERNRPVDAAHRLSEGAK